MKQITCIFMAALLSLAVFAAERPARQIQIGKKNTAVATDRKSVGRERVC